MKLRDRSRLARTLRRNSTDAERRLWWTLREAFPLYRFRRQHPIGRYIADFACPAHKLVIELDSGQDAVRLKADLTRTDELARRGYRVIRFWNNEVLQNLSGVLMTIEQELTANSLSALQGGEGARRGAEGG